MGGIISRRIIVLCGCEFLSGSACGIENDYQQFQQLTQDPSSSASQASSSGSPASSSGSSEPAEASAEIVMQKGPKPEGDVRAFDARAVIENLRSRVQYPPAK